MKKILPVLLTCGFVAFAVIVAKNEITKFVVEKSVRMTTGLDVKMRRSDVGIFRTQIGFYDFIMKNPSAYKDRNFAVFPEIFADYNLGDILKGTYHLEEVRVNLAELTIVKNADGKMNINELQPKAAPEKKDQKPQAEPKVKVDKFTVKVGKVIYKDYSRGGEPKVSEYDVNINETLTDITGADDLIPLMTSKVFLVVQRVLLRSSVSDLSNIGGALKGQMGGMLDYAGDLGETLTDDVGGTVKEGITSTKDKIKGLFR